MTDSNPYGGNPAMPERPSRPGEPPTPPASTPPTPPAPPSYAPSPDAPPSYAPPSYEPPTTQIPQYSPPAAPAGYPAPGSTVPPSSPGTQPAYGGGTPPPFQPPGYGGGSGGAEPPSGGGSGRGLWLALGGLVGALILAVGGFLALRGGDDDTSGVIAGEETTTTVATSSTSTTVTTVEETTTTTADMPDPLTTDLVATSVVQIFPAVNGVPVCQGSGTIVTADGLIVTNAHVVEAFGACNYDSLQVAITSSADAAPEVRYLAEVYALDTALDLAVIGIAYDLDFNPITVSDLPSITVGDSDLVGLGDTIRILGYPALGGDTITFTSGSVSGFTSEAGIADRAFIKTDATISGGNSGGLAINDAFEMIGIPTQASGGADLDVADCRVVTDTNGDGFVDDLDSCIPIGGFINGIRPVNLAKDLITAAAARVPVQAAPPVVGAASGDFFNVVMTSGIGDDERAIDDVKVLPSGASEVCATFDYEGMVDGTSWDALWSIDGEFIEEISIVASEWIGGAEGESWWVCATGDIDGLPDGMYEVNLYIQDEFNSSNTVYVGGPGLVEFTVVNDTPDPVCYLQIAPTLANGWGPDDLGDDQTLAPGDEAVISMPPDLYDFKSQDCNFTPGPEVYEVAITGGERVLLSGN
ncbi:MAG: serine protease [Acidimicrobiales bacterium]